MSGWGNSFELDNGATLTLDESNNDKIKSLEDVWIGVIPPKTEVLAPNAVIFIGNDGSIIELPKTKNKPPTHDPYTNPNAFIYYECSCGQILDPKTKRFAELNNRASEAGWKIRWGAHNYVPYCPKCAKDVD